jgi:hypothetical protein
MMLRSTIALLRLSQCDRCLGCFCHGYVCPICDSLSANIGGLSSASAPGSKSGAEGHSTGFLRLAVVLATARGGSEP